MENISVCIRIRPKVKEEDSPWKFENNTIYNMKSKDNFTFDKIIDNQTTNLDMFEKVIKQKIHNFLSGINLSVFAYGQTSTGKTFTMHGTEKNPGIIPQAVEEIFKLLGEDKSINKYTLKASYLELYNESVNDLLDANKKNLEVRESAQKGVFVNNLTEVQFTSKEKAMQLLKKGDSVRVIAETKLNEKSSRSHSIFRISLEVTKNVDGKNKTFFSQMNLIDLAGSENVSKAKTDGIRMKEGSNINKSLLALSNVISKLSANPKNFVNFRDSKLTRLLQNGLSGNSKTTIICTISESAACNSETLNTLHFGNKAKNIKTDIKINELKEQNKMMIENNELKNKIKLLEEMIKEKKSLTGEKDRSKKKEFIKKDNKKDSGFKSVNSKKENKDKANNNNNGTYEKIFSEEKTNENEEEKNKEMQMITALEKEINLLKRMLITNEEIGDDYEINIPENISLSSYPNNQNNYLNPNSYHHLSARKESRMNMVMSSAKRIPESASKTNQRFESHNPNHFFEPESMAPFNPNVSNSAYNRRSMSEYKSHINNSSMKNTNYQNPNLNTSSKNLMMMNGYSANNNIMSSQMKNINANNNHMMQNNFSQFNAENDIDMILNMNNQDEFNFKRNSMENIQNNSFNYNSNSNSESLQMIQNLRNENEDLKKNYFEIRNKFMETVQMKDNQIKSLNSNMTITMDNCEKIIKEAEDNFVNLKTNNEKLLRDIDYKDSEVLKFSTLAKNYENTISNLKEEVENLYSELSTYKQKNGLKEMEIEINNLRTNLNKLNNKNEENEIKEKQNLKEIEKLKQENNQIKVSAENFKSENFSYKAQVDILKKTNDSLSNDNGKLKNDIESYKNELHSNKEKVNKMKSEINQLKNEKEKLQNEKNNNSENFNNNKKGNIKGLNNKANNNTLSADLEKMKLKNQELENEIKSKNTYISLLEKEKEEYKSNNFDKESIAEYEKILDLTSNKIKEYEVKMEVAKEKIIFYEKMFKIAESEGDISQGPSAIKKIISDTPLRISNNNEENIIKKENISNKNFASAVNTNKKNINSAAAMEKGINIPLSAKSINKNNKETGNKGVSQFNFGEMESRKNSLMTPTTGKVDKNILKSNINLTNGFNSPNKSVNASSSKDLLGKKRHLSKVYQNIVDNSLKSGKSLKADKINSNIKTNEKNLNNSVHLNLKEEKENFKDACFSSFEI